MQHTPITKLTKKQQAFIGAVYQYYNTQGRHSLPWRQTTNPYNIVVSEMMLQQTQVARVIEKYHQFLTLFPTVQVLAAAPLGAVLGAWSGLGYNRRAKFLHTMAKAIVEKYDGTFPQTVSELELLPGVGHYTARAVATFAYNQPHVFIETNIRTLYLHHFFTEQEHEKGAIDDKQLLSIIEKTMDRTHPRMWYWALMDYGSYLKTTGVRIHRKSAQYQKQSAFAGSVRQVRGGIIKALTNEPATIALLQKKLSMEKERIVPALEKLVVEGMVQKRGAQYFL